MTKRRRWGIFSILLQSSNEKQVEEENPTNLIADSFKDICGRCNGEGWIWKSVKFLGKSGKKYKTSCPVCNGSGFQN